MDMQVVVINGPEDILEPFVEQVQKAVKAFCDGECLDYRFMDKARGNDAAFKDMRDKLAEARAGAEPPVIVFLHIREPLDIERAVREFEASTLLVTNPDMPVVESDDVVYDYDYNFVIETDGTEDALSWDAQDFVHELDALCDMVPCDDDEED